MNVASVTFEWPFRAEPRTLPVCLSYPVLSDYLVGASLHKADGLDDFCSRGGTMAAYTSSATAVLPAGAAEQLALFR